MQAVAIAGNCSYEILSLHIVEDNNMNGLYEWLKSDNPYIPTISITKKDALHILSFSYLLRKCPNKVSGMPSKNGPYYAELPCPNIPKITTSNTSERMDFTACRQCWIAAVKSAAYNRTVSAYILLPLSNCIRYMRCCPGHITQWEGASPTNELKALVCHSTGCIDCWRIIAKAYLDLNP
jgi:hypothetical protein